MGLGAAGLALTAALVVGTAGPDVERPTAPPTNLARPPVEPILEPVAEPEIANEPPPDAPPESKAPVEPDAPSRSVRKAPRRALPAPPPAEPEPLAADPRESPSEAELIDQARALVASEPVAAREALRQHLDRFPTGLLSDERDLLLARIALEADDRQVARSHLQRLRRRNPDSPYVRALESKLSE